MTMRCSTRYVALYCRISIDRAGRREGVRAQERWGREYAARVWPGVAVRVFVDNDLSAAADDVVRPEYDRLCAAIERGEVAHVWAVEQYRLERREVAWFTLAATMDAAGITELHTNRDGVVRVQDEVAGIKAVLGAAEVRRMKRRVHDKLAEKARLGEPSGVRPFGYRHALVDGVKTYVVVAVEADALRRVAQWVLSGWSLANIAAELTSEGLRGAHGGVIRGNTVRSMITAPTVAGYRVYQGRIVGRGNWEPIVDADTWAACRLRLSEPRRVLVRGGEKTYPIGERHWGHTTGRKYLLTGGLAVCGVCEHRMIGSVKQLRNRRAPYLLCHRSAGGRGCTGTLLGEAEQHVLDELWAKLDNPEFRNAVAADEHAGRRDEITVALAGIEKKRGELAALWATPGELTDAEWTQARTALAVSERQLRTELAELPPPAITADIDGAREAWSDMTVNEQRDFLRLFIRKITVRKAAPGQPRVFDSDRIDIDWHQRRLPGQTDTAG